MNTVQLRGIPDELLQQLTESSAAQFRSLEQEILHRLSLSYDFQLEAERSEEQAHLDAALTSGTPLPGTKADWQALRRELFPA